MIKEIDSDDNGNRIEYSQIKTINGIKREINLYLVGKKKRLLGTIFKRKGSTTFILKVIRKRSKHLFLKNRSYGFNYKLMAKCIEANVTLISFVDEIDIFEFPIDLILNKGQFLHFLEQGFEKQIFLPLKEMEKHRVNKNHKILFND